MDNFIQHLPKAELHLHIEGSLEPELFVQLAERNKIKIPYTNVEQVRQAYSFSDLASFVHAYDQITRVLVTEEDFYDLALAYLCKVSEQGVKHVEVSFDFQTYMPRGIAPATVVNGIYQGLKEGERQFGITSAMIMTFLRHLSEQEAFAVLELSFPFKDKIVAVGLAGIEDGYGPEKFQRVFERAREYGYYCVAHAGEESTAHVIWQAVELLKVNRIDHGLSCMQDPRLVATLKALAIPLTVCPLSNMQLLGYRTAQDHPLKAMFDTGLMVTINSDDPAFFGGYIVDNYLFAKEVLGFTNNDLIMCAQNSFAASFLDYDTKNSYINMLNRYVEKHEK